MFGVLQLGNSKRYSYSALTSSSTQPVWTLNDKSQFRCFRRWSVFSNVVLAKYHHALISRGQCLQFCVRVVNSKRYACSASQQSSSQPAWTLDIQKEIQTGATGGRYVEHCACKTPSCIDWQGPVLAVLRASGQQQGIIMLCT